MEHTIENLPPKCKYALLMVRLEGASYEEVAEKLGIKIHSARLLVERAMEYLLEKEVSGKDSDDTEGAVAIDDQAAA